MSILVLVWNLRFLSKNFILCGESSSTYQSSKILVLFFPSSSLPLYPFIFPNFIESQIGFPICDAKNWIHKLGFHQLVSEHWFLKSGVIYLLCFLFHVSFLLCLLCQFFLFNSILLFHLPLFYFFESIFLFWTINNINIFWSSFFFL